MENTQAEQRASQHPTLRLLASVMAPVKAEEDMEEAEAMAVVDRSRRPTGSATPARPFGPSKALLEKLLVVKRSQAFRRPVIGARLGTKATLVYDG